MTDIHYIAISESSDGLILVGTPVYIQVYKLSDKDTVKYALFGIFRVGNEEKKSQRNNVRHLTMAELDDALNGVTVILDQKYARDRIDTLLEEINELEKTYELR